MQQAPRHVADAQVQAAVDSVSLSDQSVSPNAFAQVALAVSVAAQGGGVPALAALSQEVARALVTPEQEGQSAQAMRDGRTPPDVKGVPTDFTPRPDPALNAFAAWLGFLGVTGLLVLAPLPVTMGEEDESFADDLPASAIYVHLAEAQKALRLPHMPGLMALTGTLQLGAAAEPDGRRSMLRLLLDDAVSREFEPPTSANHPSFSAFLERLNEPTR